MRLILIIFLVVFYLFTLVYVESELLKLEVRKEDLKEQSIELQNQEKSLEFQVAELSNLAYIEAAAKERGFTFPEKDEILGIIR
ncbi:hypothetical protein A2Y85_00685 [candidate division WOR-3 bacterium RBG_13_43_14]|uniref:Cell division protein FtsL n=1 Tax=candidate division WOR-3 bacterium RBG_13_43_14 TaxID=1802590 RepID=A0A1F4U8R2_UNCW3|nr:MAG: hypothetical protein A2Y85_00685 [candidate division WOR-3 bacterium RBG_13_43_14]